MSDERIVSGVVAKSTPVGESDRMLELITKERGKITVFARGCRRPRSPLVAYTRPFCFAEFTPTGQTHTFISSVKISVLPSE